VKVAVRGGKNKGSPGDGNREDLKKSKVRREVQELTENKEEKGSESNFCQKEIQINRRTRRLSGKRAL